MSFRTASAVGNLQFSVSIDKAVTCEAEKPQSGERMISPKPEIPLFISEHLIAIYEQISLHEMLSTRPQLSLINSLRHMTPRHTKCKTPDKGGSMK